MLKWIWFESSISFWGSGVVGFVWYVSIVHLVSTIGWFLELLWWYLGMVVRMCKPNWGYLKASDMFPIDLQFHQDTISYERKVQQAIPFCLTGMKIIFINNIHTTLRNTNFDLLKLCYKLYIDDIKTTWQINAFSNKCKKKWVLYGNHVYEKLCFVRLGKEEKKTC